MQVMRFLCNVHCCLHQSVFFWHEALSLKPHSALLPERKEERKICVCRKSMSFDTLFQFVQIGRSRLGSASLARKSEPPTVGVRVGHNERIKRNRKEEIQVLQNRVHSTPVEDKPTWVVQVSERWPRAKGNDWLTLSLKNGGRSLAWIKWKWSLYSLADCCLTNLYGCPP